MGAALGTPSRAVLWAAVLLATLHATAATARADEAPLAEGVRLFHEAERLAAAQPTRRDAHRAAFRKAAEAMARGVAEGKASAELCVSLGTAWAFAEEPGEAVLAYRRALVLDPESDRAAQGLEVLRRKLPIRAAAKRPLESLAAILFVWHRELSDGTKLALFAAAYLGGVALLVLGGARRRGVAALLIAAGLALFGSLYASAAAEDARSAAVLLARTEGRTGDGLVFGPSHSEPLPPGTEMVIVERRGGYVAARLLDGSQTWLPEDRIGWVCP